MTHSFPTRRSSDLRWNSISRTHWSSDGVKLVVETAQPLVIFDCDGVLVDSEPLSVKVLVEQLNRKGVAIDETQRSEEHTSELQSLMRISYAVFCLKQQTKSIASSVITRTTT